MSNVPAAAPAAHSNPNPGARAPGVIRRPRPAEAANTTEPQRGYVVSGVRLAANAGAPRPAPRPLTAEELRTLTRGIPAPGVSGGSSRCRRGGHGR